MAKNTGSMIRMQREKVLSTWFIGSSVLDADMGEKALEGRIVQYVRGWCAGEASEMSDVDRLQVSVK